VATVTIRDSREGIEVTAIYIGGITIALDVPQKITAYDIMRLSQTEDVYLNVKETD